MLLSILIFLPLLSSFLLFFISHRYLFLLRFVSIVATIETFFLSLLLWVLFDKSTSEFQFCEVYYWSYQEVFLGVDGISLFLILLTTFLIPLCILTNWNNSNFFKEYVISFLIIESFLIFIFSVLDLLMFYIFFESVLIPMFLIIGLGGSGRRKVRSSYLFFFYTLVGSSLMLLSIIYLYVNVGTFNYQILKSVYLNTFIQKFLWVAFMVAFMSKIPMVPFHIWLPEAHVEAPTGGSVLLAGVLLKLGTYGILRFLLPLFSFGTLYNLPLIYSLSGISIIYTSGTAIRQTDLKRVIAYTSIAHMNLVVIALFVLNLISIEGGIFQMLSHGIVSSALFFCIGFYYDRYNTRVIENFGGSIQFLPLLSFFFFIFTLANLAFPCTCNFIGEFLMLIGIFNENSFIAFISSFGMVLSGAYSLWIYNRICFGNVKLIFVKDLNRFEFIILFILIFFTVLFGIFPTFLMDCLTFSVIDLINFINIKLSI
jgi:proton-translocating NADH-quinone oxidoreductase chain M